LAIWRSEHQHEGGVAVGTSQVVADQAADTGVEGDEAQAEGAGDVGEEEEEDDDDEEAALVSEAVVEVDAG